MLETVATLFCWHKEYLLAAKCAEEALRIRELEPNLGYGCNRMYSILVNIYAGLKNAKMVFKYCKQLLQLYDAEKMAEELKTDFAKELLSCGKDPIEFYLGHYVWQMIECSNTPEEKFVAAACLQHLRELGIAPQWWEQALAAK